ncbi:cation transporter [Cnuibacter physcomitrellae]|uniref:Cation transporter n=1 Tax=Cnuibacter physcomitrellae TaxID=1619308 RepID=A0A1X9M0A5_9MICO|nr:cation diffusion facilitator family transporter [Cnuibacter physcomitrellae]ARJ07750.1 cation transporter [Cnuibacter physcomitrellae]GGI42999.1 cation transporter [Cnuibacter physcomitrellae]
MTGHDHGGNAPAKKGHRKRIAIALSITSTIFIAEIFGSIITGSLALLIDAAHMLTDLLGLTMALVAATLANRPTSAKRTWGFARAEVLAAMAQATVLLAVGLFVFVEGIQRLFAPPEIASGELIIFGAIGLAANIASLLVLSSSRSANFNLRAAFLEVMNDALGSVAVIVGAIVIMLTGFTQADAIAAMLIGALIIPRTLKLLKETVDVLLESAPAGLNLDEVRDHLLKLPHVVAVHDLHASVVASNMPVLSAHVVVEDQCFQDGHAPRILDDLQQCVAHDFKVPIEHSTFQLEPAGHNEHEEVLHT